MNVLVAVASKYGSTREVGQAIGDALRAANLDVDVHEPGEVTSLDGYDAGVLGSAIYMGQWLESARQLAQDQAAGLASRPTWLFSSGPIGGKPLPEQAVDVSAIVEGTRAREGDFRDWNQISAWARQVAAALQVPSAPVGNPA